VRVHGHERLVQRDDLFADDIGGEFLLDQFTRAFAEAGAHLGVAGHFRQGIGECRRVVLDRFGVSLREEIVYLGEW